MSVENEPNSPLIEGFFDSERAPKDQRFATAFFFAFPLALIPITEFVARRGADGAFSPFFGELGAFGLTYAWLLSLLALFVGAFGRYGFPVVAFALAALAAVHAGKLETLAEPLYPADVVTHASHAGDLAEFSTGLPGTVTSVGFLFALAAGWSGWAAFGKTSWQPRRRAAAFASAFLINAALVTDAFGVLSAAQRISGLTPERYAWRQMENYDGNGLLSGFFSNLGALSVHKPEEYSPAEAQRILETFSTETVSTGLVSAKPDVVVVLSESFWDPKSLPNVSFDPDPTPNFSALRRTFAGGELISPTFGGKTALVEFEILTANAVSRLPEGTIPYQQYVRSPLPSVAWEFKGAGYATFAIHPYRKRFFNRAGAYPFLGFDRFIAEEDMPNAKKKGPFVSEESFANEILSVLPKVSSDSPAFVFGVSMQNHFSYEGEKYETLATSVSGSGLSPKGTRILENYAEGVRDADAQLWRLTQTLSQSERPTLLIFFGDHLGILGENYETYRDTGYLPTSDDSGWSEADRLKMRMPPFLVWWNGAFERAYGKPEFPTGRVRATFFGTSILKAAGVGLNEAYLRFADSIVGCFSTETIRLKETGTGNCAGAEKTWDTLQYRTMFDTLK